MVCSTSLARRVLERVDDEHGLNLGLVLKGEFRSMDAYTPKKARTHRYGSTRKRRWNALKSMFGCFSLASFSAPWPGVSRETKAQFGGHCSSGLSSMRPSSGFFKGPAIHPHEPQPNRRARGHCICLHSISRGVHFLRVWRRSGHSGLSHTNIPLTYWPWVHGRLALMHLLCLLVLSGQQVTQHVQLFWKSFVEHELALTHLGREGRKDPR